MNHHTPGQYLSQDRRRLPPATEALLEKARKLTPNGSQTLSKSYAAHPWASGYFPLFVERAEGAWLVDVDGRRFLDYPMALGPVLLGHNHPKVVEAVHAQLRKGPLFSLPSPIEIEAARRVVESVPSAEMVKFLKTGSEACSAAVRLARAVTGRSVVVVGGFHGWHDFYAGTTKRNGGVPPETASLTVPFRFNDLESLEQALGNNEGRVAAVMLEPAHSEAPAPGFLEAVREMATANGALLVFDEVITGLRWARGGAQERYGVLPDLTVLGKALGNGMPIAAVTGPAELMSRFEDLFVSGTYGGECLSLAAVVAVIETLEGEPVVDYIWSQGERLRQAFQASVQRYGLAEKVTVTGEPPRVVMSFADGDIARSIVAQELAKREILFNGSFFVSYAHTDGDIDLTIEAVDESLAVLSKALESSDPSSYLLGPPGRSVL